MKNMYGKILLGLCLLAAFSAPVQADNVRSARAHFEEAQKHFAIGEFHDAGEEYQLAYKAKPDPALLYNAATAFRLGNELDRALVLYRNYLQFYPNQPNAADVRNLVDQLKEGLAAAQRSRETPPTAPLKPAPTVDEPKSEAAPVAVAPTPQTDVAVASAHPTAERHDTPVYKKWWLWTIVGVVVAGAAVGVAVAVTTPSHAWANGPTVGPGAPTSASRSAPLVEVRW